MIDAASLILRESGSSMKDLQEKFEKIGVIPVIVLLPFSWYNVFHEWNPI